MNSNSFFSLLKISWLRSSWKLIVLIIICFFSSVLELIGIGLVVPLINLSWGFFYSSFFICLCWLSSFAIGKSLALCFANVLNLLKSWEKRLWVLSLMFRGSVTDWKMLSSTCQGFWCSTQHTMAWRDM